MYRVLRRDETRRDETTERSGEVMRGVREIVGEVGEVGEVEAVREGRQSRGAGGCAERGHLHVCVSECGCFVYVIYIIHYILCYDM